jgi:hypothetical protein
MELEIFFFNVSQMLTTIELDMAPSKCWPNAHNNVPPPVPTTITKYEKGALDVNIPEEWLVANQYYVEV